MMGLGIKCGFICGYCLKSQLSVTHWMFLAERNADINRHTEKTMFNTAMIINAGLRDD